MVAKRVPVLVPLPLPPLFSGSTDWYPRLCEPGFFFFEKAAPVRGGEERSEQMIRDYDCKIVLADGSEYRGYRFGARGDRVCEIVFNTSMVGYQEIVSDPSYTDQLVVMTYPIIGNYGITDEDFETKVPTIAGVAGRGCNDIPSNSR